MSSYHQRLAALFEEVCDLDTTDRRRVLSAVDDDLRRSVLKLVEADLVASEVFASQAQGASFLASEIAHQPDPDRIGPYRIVGRLGQGAMGLVYDAEQDHPRRRVALKVLHPWMRTELALELFRFEAQALGQLLHPCIPQVYQAGEDGGIAFLAMERVEGSALLDWSRRTRASLAERTAVLARIARAVHAAHQTGLVHRDLKPANILVTADGVPKLLDFGVATARRGVGEVAGTPVYMSPEQAAGEPVDARSDLHALGTLGYELLTGVLPAEGMTIEALVEAKRQLPRPAHEIEPALDADVSAVLERALAPDPASRHPDAAAFADDLERTLRFEPLPWRARRPAYLAERFARRHRGPLAAAAGLLGLTLAATAGWVAMEWRAERMRNDLAAQHLAGLDRSIDAALGRDDWRTAEEAFLAFAEDPAHRGTPALVQAWLTHAERRAGSGRSGELEALTEAYLLSGNDEDLARVQVALARQFVRTSNWGALWHLRESLGPDVRASIVPELRQTAIALRRFDSPLAWAGPDDALVRELGKATDLGIDAKLGGLVDIDADGLPEIVSFVGDDIQQHELDGTPLVRFVRPERAGITTHRQFVERDGVLWMATGNGTLDGRLFRSRPSEHDFGIEPVMSLPRGRVSHLKKTRVGGQSRLVLGTTYPERGLFTLDTEAGTIHVPSPDTNAMKSDIMAVEAVDLDGDGQDELVVAAGAWAAHDLRVLRWTEGERFDVVARQRTGTLHDIALLPTPAGPPVIAVGKGDLERNLRVFPPEAPYGPPAGVYFFAFDGESLVPEGFLEPPLYDHPTSGPEKRLSNPLVGDFDGDGRVDLVWTLEMYDWRPYEHMWIILDVLGERRSHIVSGMNGLGATDVDGDGDDELLVADRGKHLWFVGAGSDALPPFSPDGELGPGLADVPPSDDETVRRGWERARELVSLGLVHEAAAALGVLSNLTDDTSAALACHLEAARLYEHGDDQPAAEAHWSAALDLVDSPTTREGLVRTRLMNLDFRGAQRAQGESGTARYAWLDRNASFEPVELLSRTEARHWTLERSAAIVQHAGGIRLEVFNDHGVLATRRVKVTGDVVALDLEVDIEQLELGSGVALELMDDDRSRLMVGFWGQGGGGTTKVYQHCGGDHLEDIGAPVLTEPGHLRVRAGHVGPERSLRCIDDLDAIGRSRTYPQEPIQPGEYTLVLRAHGVDDYNPPTRARVDVLAVRAVGLEPVETVQTPASEARLALFEGRVPDADAAEPVYRALALGDERALDDALAALVRDGEDQRLKWLLRSHGREVCDALERLLGPRFAATYHTAWAEAAINGEHEPETREALLRPSLASLPADDPDGARLRTWRAAVHLDRGERTKARVLAQSVLDAGSAVPTAVRIDALVLLARVATERAEAVALLREAEGLLEARDLLLDRIARYPSLAFYRQDDGLSASTSTNP